MKEAKGLKAGVVGLGMIGGGVAASLVNRGRIPFVYDVIPDAYTKHSGVPPQLASPADVAEASDIIMLAVFNAEQATVALTGENGLLSKAHEGMVVVLLSTVTVDEVKKIGSLCEDRNVAFLDCGVTPGSLAAKNGLVAMVGGDKEIVEYARPVLADWSAEIIYCGSSGTGMAVKVARNVNTFGMWRIVAESARLAKAAGVSAATYFDVLQILDKRENLHYNFLQKLASADDGRLPARMQEIYPKFMTKDLEASIELSNALGVDMPVRDAVYDLINDTCDLV